MTRAEKAKEAQRLRAAGLSSPVIANRLGVAESTVRNYFCAGTCADCGGPTDGSNGKANASKRCLACTKYWTPERITAALQDWAGRHGQEPYSTDAGNRGHPRDPSLPHVTQVVEAFGSWNAGLKAAGLPTHRRYYTRYRPGVLA